MLLCATLFLANTEQGRTYPSVPYSVSSSVEGGSCTFGSFSAWNTVHTGQSYFSILWDSNLSEFDLFFTGFDIIMSNPVLIDFLRLKCGVTSVQILTRAHTGTDFEPAVSQYLTFRGIYSNVTYEWELKIEATDANSIPITTATRTVIDTTAPTLLSFVRQTPAASPTNADSLVFRATFDEDVANVTTGDFDVNGTTTATVTGVSAVTSTSVYDITVSGGDLAGFGGTVGLDLAAGQDITDIAGNALPAGEPTPDETYVLDNVVPTVAITTDSGGTFNESAPATFTATVTFSEAVTGFTPGEITATNASVAAAFTTGSDGAAVYTIVITPAGTGDVGLNVDSSVAADGAANANTAAPEVTVTQTDDVAPTATITTGGVTSFNESAPGTFTATVTFSEGVNGFVASELVATNATVSAFVTGVDGDAVYTMTITPAGTGDVTLNVAAGVGKDAALNDNTIASQVTVTQTDDVGPTLTLVSIASSNADPTIAVLGDTITISITTSELLAGYPTVTIAGLPATVSGMAPNLIATLVVDAATPLGSAAINISAFEDLSGNPGATVTATTDGSSVTVGLAGASVEETHKVIAEFILNRANNILANQPSMIEYLNGTNNEGGGPAGFLGINGNEGGMDLAFSTSLSKLDRERAKSLAALAAGRVEEAHQDEAIYASSLASLMPAQSTDTEPTTSAALGNDPSTSGDQTYAADLGDGVEDMGSYTAMPDRRYDIWTEIYGATSTAGDAESSLWVGYLGAHYFLTPDLIIGGMVQLDWAKEKNDTANSEADGHGWMAGPYIAGRFIGTSLSYEAKALWGRSDNTVSPIGTYEDDFDTERFMASGKLQGTYVIDGLTINPALSVAYWEETQESYTDSNALFIPSQKITLGEVRFGPSFSKTLQPGSGSIFTPTFGIAGVWNFDVANNAASQANTLGDNDLRARVDAGFSFTNTLGWTLAASGYYDGIGLDDYEAMGGKVRLTIPVQ